MHVQINTTGNLVKMCVCVCVMSVY